MSFQQTCGHHGLIGRFDAFRNIGWVRHGFTAKTFHDGTLWDLSPKREDRIGLEQARTALADEMALSPSSLVFAKQIHSDHIQLVSKDEIKNLPSLKDFKDTDGLITNQPNIALVTFYADCVPLFFLDLENKAIGLSHAGWKGTLLEIGPKTLREMKKHFRTDPKDVLMGIGPSIGPCCFEVGLDVAQVMKDTHPWWEKHITEKMDQKFLVDLWNIHKEQFLRAGGREDNISMAKECTKCQSDRYHSYRRDGEKAGRMAAFFAINP